MDYALETTFDIKFSTRSTGGVPTTFAGTPAIEIYEDNSTTQITTAETLTVDFDAVTGLNNLRIAATAANGFESGKSYAAVVSAGTVDSVSVVGETICNFSVERAAASKGNKYSGPRGPGVYLNDAASNTNTVLYTDGTYDNPVSTIAAAKTIADAAGMDRLYLVNDSEVTLAATMQYEFVGIGEIMSNVVNLGSQDVSNSSFYNLAIEGTQGGSGRILATDCALQDPGPGDTTLHIFACRCGIVDRIQVDTSNDNVFDSCYSLVAGTSAPVIEATGASGTISVRHHSGGVELESLSPSHDVSVETDGQVILNASCSTSATVVVRGMATVIDNAGLGANLTVDAAWNRTAYPADGSGFTLHTDWADGGRLDLLLDSVNERLEGGIVNVDATTGSAGGVGTPGDPVDTYANAFTLASAGAKRIAMLTPGHNGQQSLPGIGTYDLQDIEFNLRGWSLTKGGLNTVTLSAAALSTVYSHPQRGTLSGADASTIIDLGNGNSFKNLNIQWAQAQYGYFEDCNITGTFDAYNSSNAPMVFWQCYSTEQPSNVAVVYDLTNGGNTQPYHFFDWWGNLSVVGMHDSQVMNLLGWSGGSVNVNGTGGTIYHDSHVEITDSSGGAITITPISSALDQDGVVTALGTYGAIKKDTAYDFTQNSASSGIANVTISE